MFHTSSTSILVQWGDVPAADQNGIILSYTVTYKALPGCTPKTEVFIAPTTGVTLTDLNEFTNYSITVFTSTVKGAGNDSEPIIVITDEDSKARILGYKRRFSLRFKGLYQIPTGSRGSHSYVFLRRDTTRFRISPRRPSALLNPYVIAHTSQFL